MPEDIPTSEVIKLKNSGQSKEQITNILQSKGYKPYQISEAINQAEIKAGVESNMAQMQPPSPEEKPSAGMQVSALDKEPAPPTPPLPQAPPAPQPSPVPEVPSPPAPGGAEPQAQQIQTPPAPQVFEPGPSEPVIPGQASGLESYEDVQAIVEEIIDEKWKEVTSTLGDITAWKTQIENDTEAVKQELVRLSERFDRLQAAVVGKVEDYNKNIKDIGTELKAMEKVFEKILEPLTTNIKELNKITEKFKNKK